MYFCEVYDQDIVLSHLLVQQMQRDVVLDTVGGTQ